MSINVFKILSDALMSNDSTNELWKLVSDKFFFNNVPDIHAMVYFKTKHSKDLWNHTLQVIENVPHRLELKFAALFHDIAKPETYSFKNGEVHFLRHEALGGKKWIKFAISCGLLETDREFVEHVKQLIEEHLTIAALCSQDVRDSVVRKLIEKMGDRLNDLFDLSLSDITSTHPKKLIQKKDKIFQLKERIRILIEEDKNPTPKLKKGLGLILMKELNIPAGPQLGSIMKRLEEKLIKRELTLESDFVKEAKEILNEKA